MKHSHQRDTRFASTEAFIRDFGIDSVSESLIRSHERKNKQAMLEDDDARILHCSDSVGLQLCASIRRVASTNGVSLAFSAQDSSEILLNEAFISEFLDEPIAV